MKKEFEEYISASDKKLYKNSTKEELLNEVCCLRNMIRSVTEDRNEWKEKFNELKNNDVHRFFTLLSDNKK